jgi:ABC-type spermidine/putrescine transport system permease subunit II
MAESVVIDFRAALTSNSVMDFTLSDFIAGLLFGTIGMWLWSQSKRRMNPMLKVIGAIMMVYPWFVSDIWLQWLVGIGLCVWARFAYWS